MDSYPHYAGNCVTRFPKEFDRKSRLQAISLTREDSLLVSSLARGLLLFLTVWLIAATLLVAHPKIVPGRVPGPAPDSPDYAYGAAALLMGHYEVEWPGVGGERHVPRYSPGFSIMLMPAVAWGGVGAAVWIPYLSIIVLLCLSALLALRLAGAGAAFLVTLLLLFSNAIVLHAGMVMSDLPSATLLMLELWIIVTKRGRVAWLTAGVLAGMLIWIRPANAVLLFAGLFAATAVPDRAKHMTAYLLAALPFGSGLGAWQWWMFGSPLRTGYQVAKASPGDQETLTAFFSPQYIFGNPWGASYAIVPHMPNSVAYIADLLGVRSYLVVPGVGLIGLVALISFARRNGAWGVIGRFGLATFSALSAVYLPYFWQDPRFLLAPAILLTLAASLYATQGIAMFTPLLVRGIASAVTVRAVPTEE